MQKRPTKHCRRLYRRTIELTWEQIGVFCTKVLVLWSSFAKEVQKRPTKHCRLHTRTIELTPENILQVVLFRWNGEISGEFIAVKGAAEALKHRCCSVLQCVAVCCSVLQCVAVWNGEISGEFIAVKGAAEALKHRCYSVLQCVAVCCSVLPCAAVCCRVLPCVAVCCSVLQCV